MDFCPLWGTQLGFCPIETCPKTCLPISISLDNYSLSLYPLVFAPWVFTHWALPTGFLPIGFLLKDSLPIGFCPEIFFSLSICPNFHQVYFGENTALPSLSLPPVWYFFLNLFLRRPHYHKLMKSCHLGCIGCTTVLPESIMISLVNPLNTFSF